MAAPPLLILRDIHLGFGGTPLLTGAELMVLEGDRIGLVGRNGSGKSTLLKIVAGLVVADAGESAVRSSVTVRYLPQEPDLSGFASTLAYVEAGLGPGDDPYRAEMLLRSLGMTGAEEPATLSGGEIRRCALARTLAPVPDILLLDEPTNHLDLPAIEWLEGQLASLRAALVLISHDRRFLERLTTATVWLDRGRTRRLDRGFAAFEPWRDALIDDEEKERNRLDKRIAAETEWVRYGVTARRKRNMGRLRSLQGLRQERRDQRQRQGDVKMAASEALASGKLVIEAVGVAKSFGPRAIVSELSLRLRRGERLGIVGPNGAGKTTLLRLLTGALAPDAGSVRLGANLAMVTLDQARDSLDPAVSLVDTLTGGRGDTVFVNGSPRHVMGYLKDFLFTPEQVRTPVGALSGGERGRLMLARALASPSNLLVLDEPTNDLDLETLDLLEELIGDYAGTVLLVSHDRDFLDRTATAVLAYEAAGRWQDYAGGYTDMVGQRGHGVDARERTPAPPRERTPAPARSVRAAAAATSPGDSPAAPASRRRITFKQAQALERLPRQIEALAAEIASLEGTLADAGLFARDPSAFQAATRRIGEAHHAFRQAEEAWLELEMLREEIEAAGPAPGRGPGSAA